MTTAPELVLGLHHIDKAAASVRLPECCDTHLAVSVWLVDETDRTASMDWAVVVVHEPVCRLGGESPRLRLVAAS